MRPGSLGSLACWPLLLSLPHLTSVPQACPQLTFRSAAERGRQDVASVSGSLSLGSVPWQLGRGGRALGFLFPSESEDSCLYVGV